MAILKTIAMILWPYEIIRRQNQVIEKQKGSVDCLIDEIKEMRKKLAEGAICRFNRMPRSEDLQDGKCWLTFVNMDGWVFDDPYKCSNWTHWVPYWFIPFATAPTEPLADLRGPTS
jgi:hypothetical protein